MNTCQVRLCQPVFHASRAERLDSLNPAFYDHGTFVLELLTYKRVYAQYGLEYHRASHSLDTRQSKEEQRKNMSSNEAVTDQQRPPWFRASTEGRFSPAMRRLLLEYSNIPAVDVEHHVYSVREKAWQVWPYPCIEGFSFLTLAFTKHPQYNTILEQLKCSSGDDKLIDLGCCFGQELRKLSFDGVPRERLYGSDLRLELLDLGFELFNDRDKWSASSFFPMDIFSPAVPENMRFSIVRIAMVFHLFTLDRQILAAIEVVTKILEAKPGALIIGSQAGSINPRAIPSRQRADKESYMHDESSFQAMWDEVGKKTESKWEVNAKLLEQWNKDDKEDRYFNRDDMRWLVFSVRRL